MKKKEQLKILEQEMTRAKNEIQEIYKQIKLGEESMKRGILKNPSRQVPSKILNDSNESKKAEAESFPR